MDKATERKAQTERKEMITAFYDLKVSPPSYDFVGFVVAAEKFRIEQKKDRIRFIIVPGPIEGFRDDRLPPSADKRRMMLSNVVIPLCDFLPSLEHVVVCATRQAAYKEMTGVIFPAGYSPSHPRKNYGLRPMVQAWNAKVFPFRSPQMVEYNPKLITITLREVDYWKTRNSNREAWIAAAKRIKELGYEPLFILDEISQPIEYNSDTLASSWLARRGALYSSAKHNFFVNNGPAWLAAFMPDVNATIFAMTNQKAPCCSAAYFTSFGFPEGSQIGREGHNIVWKPDIESELIPEVERICR